MFPDDAVTIWGQIDVASSTANTTLLNLATAGYDEITVLYARMYSDLNVANQNFSIRCGTDELVRQTSRSVSSSMPIEKSSEVWGKHVCGSNLILRSDASPSFTSRINYSLTYVPYNIHDVRREVLYGDWLFAVLTIIFLISVVTWGFYTSIFKPKNDTH